MFHSMGIDTGIELNDLLGAVEFLEKILNRTLPGRMSRVLKFQQSGSVM
jgi:hypothetical protein